MRKKLVYFCVLLFTIAPLVEASAQNFTREEIVFKSGDNVLSGTLVLPNDAENVPVLVFIGGMEEWGDFNKNRQPFIEENLISVFPRSGIGVMYYNPRGVGDSDGKWQRTPLSGFADDAIAGIQYLNQRKEVDPSRIGIIGHGEDGWVAQMVAAKAPDLVKIMVSLGGPTMTPERQLVNEYFNEYVCGGQDSSAAYEKAVQKAQSHQNWVDVLPLTKSWRHMKLKQGFEPAEYIEDISIPSLFLFGENDGDVYPDWARQDLNEIFPDSLPSNIDVYTIPGANHFFYITNSCFGIREEQQAVKLNFSFRFKEVFQNWVFEHL
jgi:pimeloyl-ACP methyl ester carboxylesterase